VTEYLLPRILFILCDFLIAILLSGIGYYADHRKLLDKIPTAKTWQENLSTFLPIFYLFNPVMIASCVSMSTVIFNNLAIAIMLYFALRNNIILSMFGLAVAVYLTVYPVVLVVPIIVLFHQVRDKLAKKNIGVSVSVIIQVLFWFIAWQALLQYMSYSLMGHSWDFVQQAYIYPLTVTDLTPNWGNFWYFFIEVFDHFRQFFLLMFNVHLLSYVVPLCIRFRYVQ
jgi:phosphatidylinositol glycan class U